MAIIKRNKKIRSQEVNEKAINPNEKIKSTELEAENEEVQDEEIKPIQSRSKKKVIGKGGRVNKIPVAEESELEDDSDLYEEEEEEATPQPSSKRKVIGEGGKIFKPPVVEKSEVSSTYSDLEDLEEDEEDESLSYYLDKLHEDETDEELEDDFYEEETESDLDEDESDSDDVSESDTYEDEEEADDDEKWEEEEVILKASKRKKSQCILQRKEFSEQDITYINGIPTVPFKIESYEKEKITFNEARIIEKIGIKSIEISESEIFPVKMVGAGNSFAVLEKSDEYCSLRWSSDFIKLEHKSKGTNGKVYVDVIVEDELSSKKITVPVSTLTDKYKIKTLSNYDIHVSPTDSMTVAVALKKVLEKMPIHDKNKTLGVVSDTGSELGFSFNGYNSIDAFEVQNNCIDYDDYLEKFNVLLEKSVPLQFLISATMGAAILTILQEAYNYDLHSYCINIVGSSSTGKTISSQVAASMWTNPTSDKIFSAMLSTINAALKRLSGRNGVPTFVDEASAVVGNIKAEEYVYQVYEQCEKHRLNSDCSEKESGKWSTVVVMTSEQKFAASTKNQNGGLAVRIHVIENQKWTIDKNHAESLMKFIRSNYGVVGKEFTDCLFSEDIFEKLPERYEEAREAITKLCNKNRNDFTDRLCQTYAVTLMTAQILKDEIGLDIDIKGVAKILINHNKYVSKEQNLALNAYKAIVSYAIRNPYRSGIRREIEHKKLTKLIIEESLTADILKGAGFQDVNIAVRKLDEAGFLIRQGQGKGLKSKLTIDDALCWCYQIDLTIME